MLNDAMVLGLGMHGFGMHEWGPAAWPLLAVWILFKVAFWALLITGLVLAVRWLRHGRCEGWRRTPLEVLKMRYARGDVNREEFEAMKRELETS